MKSKNNTIYTFVLLLVLCINSSLSAQTVHIIPAEESSTMENINEIQKLPYKDRYVKITKSSPDCDKFEGLTKKIGFHRVITPYGLEVAFEKTTHIIFPAPIRYVDLGNENIVAGVAGDAENVLRVKAAEDNFEGETNLSVITENGYYYTFNVKYAKEPEKLAIEMQDFISDGDAVNRPNNTMAIYLKELNNENPQMVRAIMKSIDNANQRLIKHIGSRAFGIQAFVKGIYSFGGILYFSTEIKNNTNVPFVIDYITFTIVDKKVVKRTTIQETVINPVRAFNYVTEVATKMLEKSVFAFPIFTIPADKVLQVEIHEKNGGRHQSFQIENSDIVHARRITDFILQ